MVAEWGNRKKATEVVALNRLADRPVAACGCVHAADDHARSTQKVCRSAYKHMGRSIPFGIRSHGTVRLGLHQSPILIHHGPDGPLKFLLG